MMVVSNTSPLIALSKIDKLIILKKLFKQVNVPKSVAHEFETNCSATEKLRFDKACAEFLKLTGVDNRIEFTRKLGRGEQDAIALAIENKAMLIIDDKKGRNEAQEHFVTAVSTRALLMIAEEKHIVCDRCKLEAQLKYKNFFVPNY